MFKLKLERLMKEFGVKQEALIETINTTRVTFGKKMKDNSFSDIVSRFLCLVMANCYNLFLALIIYKKV